MGEGAEGEVRRWFRRKRKKRRRKRGRKRGEWRDAGRMEVVEPWIDVSPACPAGRERLRLDVLSFPLSFSLSPSLFPPLCVYPGPLIRRELGDNSSLSLSLDDARFPPARRPTLSRPVRRSRTLPRTRTRGFVPFPTAFDVTNGTRSGVGRRREVFPPRHRFPSPPFVGGAHAEDLFLSRCHFVRCL